MDYKINNIFNVWDSTVTISSLVITTNDFKVYRFATLPHLCQEPLASILFQEANFSWSDSVSCGTIWDLDHVATNISLWPLWGLLFHVPFPSSFPVCMRSLYSCWDELYWCDPLKPELVWKSSCRSCIYISLALSYNRSQSSSTLKSSWSSES